MRTIILNREFDSHSEIMRAVAAVIEKNDNVISANYNENCIIVHELTDGEIETVEWYCDSIFYGDGQFVKSVDIDC